MRYSLHPSLFRYPFSLSGYSVSSSVSRSRKDFFSPPLSLSTSAPSDPRTGKPVSLPSRRLQHCCCCDVPLLLRHFSSELKGLPSNWVEAATRQGLSHRLGGDGWRYNKPQWKHQRRNRIEDAAGAATRPWPISLMQLYVHNIQRQIHRQIPIG